MLIKPQYEPLVIAVAMLIVGGCKKDECDFQNSKYFIEFSEESKLQLPLLDKDSIIIESVIGIDTIELKNDLAGEGTRKSAQSWTCTYVRLFQRVMIFIILKLCS